jgi:hypothetical protein
MSKLSRRRSKDSPQQSRQILIAIAERLLDLTAAWPQNALIAS